MSSIVPSPRYRRSLGKRILSVVGASCCLAVLAASASGGSSASVRGTAARQGGLVKVSMIQSPTEGALAVWVALEKGIFKKNGLDVSITPNSSINAIAAAVSAGQYDFGEIPAPLFLNALNQNISLVVTAGGQIESSAFPGLGIAVPANSQISKAGDLEGKTVGTPALVGNFPDCLEYWLYTHGAHVPAVHLQQVPLPSMQAQLDAKLIDAAIAPPPFLTAITQAGYTNLGDPCLSITPSGVSAFEASPRGWALSHRNVIGAMQKSIDQANTYIQTHPAQAKAVLVQYSGVSPSSVGTKFPKYVGRETRADVYAWEKALLTLGLLKSPINLANAFVGPNT